MLVAIYAPALMIILLFAAVAKLDPGISIEVFLTDPAALLRVHPLVGIQSNLGVLVWCAAAAVCLFTSAVVRVRRIEATEPRLFLGAGAITSVLLLDDFFLFHEDLAFRYLSFYEESGIYDDFILLVYGCAILAYVIRFREPILRSKYLILFLLALTFLGVSASIDLMDQFFHDAWDRSWILFFEEGFKFLGIVSWGGYWIGTCFCAIAPERRQASE